MSAAYCPHGLRVDFACMSCEAWARRDAPGTVTVTTETHKLTHEQIVAAIFKSVLEESDLGSRDTIALAIDIHPDCTWEAAGKNEYRATVKIEVRS